MGAQELPGGPGFIVLYARELLFLPISISQESKMNYVGSEMSANDASLYPVHLPSSCHPLLPRTGDIPNHVVQLRRTIMGDFLMLLHGFWGQLAHTWGL